MSDYHFVTLWRVHAPADRVWEAIVAVEQWPRWWPNVVHVAPLEPADADGVGGLFRIHWTTRLPYSLAFDFTTTRAERPTRLEGTASGELEGEGRWRFTEAEGSTLVRYDWIVRTNKWWMNLLAPVARPLFAWNHDQVMSGGARGLAALLGVSVDELEEYASPAPAPG